MRLSRHLEYLDELLEEFVPLETGPFAAAAVDDRFEAGDGGRGRTRTDMRLPSADFESAVAANFTTRPCRRLYRNRQELCVCPSAQLL